MREVLLGRRPTADSQQASSQPCLGLGSRHPLGSFLFTFLPPQSRSCLLSPRSRMARHHAELPTEAAGWHLGVILPELSGQRLTQLRFPLFPQAPLSAICSSPIPEHLLCATPWAKVPACLELPEESECGFKETEE